MVPASVAQNDITHLGYHKTTRTWQGFYEKNSAGLCFTHSDATGRSEGEALIMVIKRLVEKHLASFPKDRLWAHQLMKVDQVIATEDFL